MFRCILLALLAITFLEVDGLAQVADRHGWCNYPRKQRRRAFASREAIQFRAVTEQEPNNSPSAAESVPLGFGATDDIDVDVSGRIDADDVDIYEFEVPQGATLGLACLGNSLDSVLTLLDESSNALIENDQHSGIADIYPVQSPFPAGGQPNDAALTFTFPTAGRYFVKVGPFGTSQGDYVLQMRLRQPKLRSHQLNSRQIVYLDFRETSINAERLFGSGGNRNARLSPLRSFLGGWGLAETDEDAVINSIVAHVEDHFADTHLSDLNDRDSTTTDEHGSYAVTIRNSRDHGNLVGQGNVTRVIIGGTIAQLGIGTIGIAQHIDPGNFSTEDTAVVLLDLLSLPVGSPQSVNSINSIPLDPGTSKIEAVGRVVAAVASHEVGHTLGCWHCNNSNGQASLMDQGGNLPNTAGVGPDGILGSADDVDVRFRADFYANEGISETDLIENVDARVAFALSTGTLDASTFLVAAERDLLRAQMNAMRLEQRPTAFQNFDRSDGQRGMPPSELTGAPMSPSLTELLSSLSRINPLTSRMLAGSAAAQEQELANRRALPAEIANAAGELSVSDEIETWVNEANALQQQIERIRRGQN